MATILSRNINIIGEIGGHLSLLLFLEEFMKSFIEQHLRKQNEQLREANKQLLNKNSQLKQENLELETVNCDLRKSIQDMESTRQITADQYSNGIMEIAQLKREYEKLIAEMKEKKNVYETQMKALLGI